MKSPASCLIGLFLVLAGSSRSPATADQMKRAEALTIGVTVEPTCTVAVNPRERKPEEAIDLLCRNFRESQPEPLVLETVPRDGHDVVLIRF